MNYVMTSKHFKNHYHCETISLQIRKLTLSLFNKIIDSNSSHKNLTMKNFCKEKLTLTFCCFLSFGIYILT